MSSKTYIDIDQPSYKPAKIEVIPKNEKITEKTWGCSIKARSVLTSKTTGNIKLRISPREIPVLSSTKSTQGR